MAMVVNQQTADMSARFQSTTHLARMGMVSRELAISFTRFDFYLYGDIVLVGTVLNAPLKMSSYSFKRHGQKHDMNACTNMSSDL